jgi:hypothetical protein
MHITETEVDHIQICWELNFINGGGLNYSRLEGERPQGLQFFLTCSSIKGCSSLPFPTARTPFYIAALDLSKYGYLSNIPNILK